MKIKVETAKEMTSKQFKEAVEYAVRFNRVSKKEIAERMVIPPRTLHSLCNEKKTVKEYYVTKFINAGFNPFPKKASKPGLLGPNERLFGEMVAVMQGSIDMLAKKVNHQEKEIKSLRSLIEKKGK